MIKTNLYNKEGAVIGELDLPENIFGLKPNQDLIHEAVVAQESASRVKYAHVKMRGEVAGGGKKPWAQKHTGQARHGSSRSPIWRKGGVTFGPTDEANYKKKINLKKKRLALLMVIASKFHEKTLFVIDDLQIAEAKTKEIVKILQNLKLEKSTLIGLSKKDNNIYLASRNIEGVMTISLNSLNVVDLLRYKNLLIPKEAIDVIKRTYKISK